MEQIESEKKYMKNYVKIAIFKAKFEFYRLRYRFVKNKIIRFNVLSEIETVEAIIDHKASITRLGEGEFRWMLGESYNSFQSYDPVMKDRLLETLNSKKDNLLVSITPVLADEKYMGDRNESKYWEFILGKEGEKWAKLLDSSRTYYNPNISRFYMAYKDVTFAKKMVESLKRIWDKQDVLIVEGDLTRFGVANDLLDNANSVRRIIAPSENAFSKYEKILSTITRYANDGPVLMALGPTASILAYDLSKLNIWAIDIGHADIEYEWFKVKAKEKIPIRGKYVNEAGGNTTFVELETYELEEYKKQILCYV